MRLIAGITVLLLSCATQAQAQNECTALQTEVESLRAKLRAYETGNAQALQPLPTVSASAPAAVAAPVVLATPAAAAVEASPAGSNAADSALPGTAPKPAPIQRVVTEEPYSRTGCSKGLFRSLAPAAWQDATLWLDLEKGQTPAEVEALLGVEHYDERGGRNVIWHFGKCGAASRAKALFTDGKLVDWRAPLG